MVQAEGGGNFARAALKEHEQQGGKDHDDGVKFRKP